MPVAVKGLHVYQLTHLVLSVLCYLWQPVITMHSATFANKNKENVFE